MSLQTIFKSPFTLINSEESDINIQYPHVDKYVDNEEITGNFLIHLEITLYIDPSLKEDNYKIKQYIPEDECVICYENKPNILYTNCLHFVVCKDCDNNGNFSKCPLCRKKIKSERIIFS